VKRTGCFSILLAAASLLCASCGGGSEDDAATKTVTVEQRSDPISCLEQAGLSGAEQRGANLWRAFDDRDGTVVLIDLYDSPSQAQESADLMTGVWNAVVGSYVVTGPAKPPLGQSTVGEDNVQAVASCLAG
jgi:spermidine/putrescine-binding protein